MAFDVLNVAGEYHEPNRKLDPLIYDLRKRRYDLGWSLTLLSHKMGFSKQAIREWENGHAYPSFFALRTWCDTLNCTLKVEDK